MKNYEKFGPLIRSSLDLTECLFGMTENNKVINCISDFSCHKCIFKPETSEETCPQNRNEWLFAKVKGE